MKSGVSVVNDKLKVFERRIRAMCEEKVLVGIPQKTTQREDDPYTNAQIGYLMENGSTDGHIPKRASLLPGVQSAQEQISAILKNANLAAIQGDMAAFHSFLNAAGLLAVNAVQAKITDGPFVALAKSTLLARERRRAATGGKSVSLVPLIDTGQFRRAITYIIRKV